MARGEDSVTLEMVWGAAEAAARENKCSIQALTTRQLQEIMPYGSTGCITAFLRQVRIQDRVAQSFDWSNYSPGFKAAIVGEFRRFVENAVETAHQEAKITEEMFDQTCRDLEATEAENKSLRDQLSINDSRAYGKIKDLEIELTKAQERLQLFEDLRSSVISDQNSITELKIQIAEISTERDAERTTASRLRKQLAETELQRQSAAQKASLAEHRAMHAESLVEEKREQITDLRAELFQARAARRDLEVRMTEMLSRLNQEEPRAKVHEITFPVKEGSDKDLNSGFEYKAAESSGEQI